MPIVLSLFWMITVVALKKVCTWSQKNARLFADTSILQNERPYGNHYLLAQGLPRRTWNEWLTYLRSHPSLGVCILQFTSVTVPGQKNTTANFQNRHLSCLNQKNSLSNESLIIPASCDKKIFFCRQLLPDKIKFLCFKKSRFFDFFPTHKLRKTVFDIYQKLRNMWSDRVEANSTNKSLESTS